MDKKPLTSTKAIKKTAIYVDVEDDLTSIISKVKSSSGDMIALVPPRRVGVLQSTVNLKLLKKEADNNKKELILITSDKTLGALASSAKIPIAKNLTTEAKLLDIPEDDDEDEIITGMDQTIGELDKKSKQKGDNNNAAAAVKAIADDDQINDIDEAEIEADGKKKKDNKKSKSMVPNFKKFRKWIILGAVALIGVVGLLVWMFVFSTAAITITAKTSEEKIDQPVSLSIDNQTDVSENRLHLASAEPVKKTNQIEFTATGTKEIGEKASGSVIINNNQTPFDPYTGNSNTISLSAGTTVYTSGGMQYTIDSSVTVGGGSSSSVNATAVAVGSDYNISSGTTMSVAGYAQSILSATVGSGGITGGSKETVTVVQQSDIDAITDKIKDDTGSDSVRTELTARFANDVMPIEDSFNIDFGNITSSPAVGEQASRATATIEITYSMYGVTKEDVNAILMAAAVEKLKDQNNQMVFDDGFDQVQLLSFNRTNMTMRLATTAKIGPNINEDQVREDSAGKKSNEISSAIEKINGVENVDVDIPFWLGGVAPDANRIVIIKSGL